MNTAALKLPAAGALDLGARLWRDWRSLRRVELLCFAGVGLLYGLTDIVAIAQLPDEAPRLQVAGRHLLLPVLVALLLIPFWLPASRSTAEPPRRIVQLGAAALLGSAAATLLLWRPMRALGWPSMTDLQRVAKGLPLDAAWSWGPWLGETLAACVPALLAFGLLDFYARRLRSARELQRVRLAHVRLSREVMSARLAALQAHVEPGFLFDTLEDIERAYARGETDAGERIERLIHHLRMALPGMRPAGSTLGAEVQLLASWLAVVEDRLGRRVPLQTGWPAALDAVPMPPMLLLPLLQCTLQPALQGRAAGPGAVALHIDAQAPQVDAPAAGAAGACGASGELCLVVTLGPAPALPCPEATLLQTLAARASAMHGAPVSLACGQQAGPQGLHTCITLRFPPRTEAQAAPPEGAPAP